MNPFYFMNFCNTAVQLVFYLGRAWYVRGIWKAVKAPGTKFCYWLTNFTPKYSLTLSFVNILIYRDSAVKQRGHDLKKEDNLKNEDNLNNIDNLKDEYDHKKEDDLKNECHLMNEGLRNKDNLKKEDNRLE